MFEVKSKEASVLVPSTPTEPLKAAFLREYHSTSDFEKAYQAMIEAQREQVSLMLSKRPFS